MRQKIEVGGGGSVAPCRSTHTLSTALLLALTQRVRDQNELPARLLGNLLGDLRHQILKGLGYWLLHGSVIKRPDILAPRRLRNRALRTAGGFTLGL